MQKYLKIEPHNNLANIFSCIAVLQVEHFQGEVAAQTNCNGFESQFENKCSNFCRILWLKIFCQLLEFLYLAHKANSLYNIRRLILLSIGFISVTKHQIYLLFTIIHFQGAEGDKSIKLAMESPARFVIKPQREGGGKRTYLLL